MIATPFSLGSRRGPRPPAPSTSPVGARPLAYDALDHPLSYDEIFRIVRQSARNVIGKERTGLSLALSDLPPSLGAFWPVTGNLIVMNEGLVATMRRYARSEREFNSFVYVILAHEYLHTLGYLSESEVRPATARVARATFGPDHFATRMAEGNLWSLYPFLQEAPGGRGRRLRMVPDFDRAATSTYIR